MTTANPPVSKPTSSADQEREDSPGALALRERLKAARKVFLTGNPTAV